MPISNLNFKGENTLKIPKKLPKTVKVEKSYWNKLTKEQLQKVLKDIKHEIKRKKTKKNRIKNVKLALIPIKHLQFVEQVIQGELTRREKNVKTLEITIKEDD